MGRESISPADIDIVPANQASWADLQAVFGTRGDAHGCQCQWFKLARGESFRSVPLEERAARLREQTEADHPDAATTSGLVAYLDEEPVGWCAVEPRTAYVGLVRSAKVPWAGRDEDKTDASVWAITCFVVRVGYRKRGIGMALAKAAVDFARERGASAVEAYPMTTTSSLAGEMFVGTTSMFAAAGLGEVTRPTQRRAVMRLDF